MPYGEFIPFESFMPWLRDLLPPIGDFIPGEDYTVFHPAAGEPVPPFSALICFEDIFPGLARQFVRSGAKWLIVMNRHRKKCTESFAGSRNGVASPSR